MRLTKNKGSVMAINQYVLEIKSNKEDVNRHKAMVLTQNEGYPILTYVGVIEGKENTTIIIENLPSKFITNTFKSNEYDFEYFPTTKTLVIKSIKDLSEHNLEINISSLKAF